MSDNPFQVGEDGHLVSAEVPQALSWCNQNSLYARILFEVDSKGKASKKAVCLTKSMLYVCDTNGTVDKAVKLKDLREVVTQDLEVKKHLMSSKAREHHVLVKLTSSCDILFRLYTDKANTVEGNDEVFLERALLEIARREGTEASLRKLTEEEAPLTDLADWTVPEGHVDMKAVLEARLREKEKVAEKAQIGSPQEPAPEEESAVSQEPSAAQPTAAAPAASGTVYNHDVTLGALSEKVRQLEASVALANSQLHTEKQTSAKHAAEAASLREKLEEEKASREDLVRDMRADFDTQFIKKQADEFELRQRQFQRLRDKDQARIKDLEARAAEPRTYSGPADMMEKVRNLEKQLADSESRLDVAECRSIHFENDCDEQYSQLKKMWEFIQEGALVRIRDLQAGKDHRKLPLLPKVPPQPKAPAPFEYDATNKPKRAAPIAAAAAAPAASLDLDDDLDLGIAPSKPAAGGIDLDDDLDIDLGAPSKPAASIDLDNLL